ncbi:CDP-glucose 4,6-dehydratase [Pedobacter puniceum]|uniref:CDP-glucose 4,6-dehydratase n=1 Tax=Pedobacter puniceum TaxID=2666136 RepID=A0A7K0FKP7_9SPHI|nr:CDP-glucose 4,6-dehydratase [Pedobacter puniceum]MRX45687.1 CDP-glucose 4,6-dehydratase [Pedobacter puniceum]
MKNDFKNIYQNKKVFVTGHTGFKGSWLICWLYLLGAKVKGYALDPENDFDLYPNIKGDELCQSEIADIRDAETLKKSILDFQPDFIFHLAAQPLVRLSYKVPLETFSINVNGTANVLDALRFLDKPCIAVMVTTDKVYHNQEKNYAYQETDRLGGYDPYSASKAAAELVIDSYRKSFFNPLNYATHQKSISVARAGNVIGGGDWAKDRIIPDIVRALQAEQEIEVRNPNAVRPWQHVLEPLSGYLTLAAKQTEDPIQFADAFNFGPEPSDNLTVKELVNFAIDIWGKGKASFALENNGHHEAQLLQLNISKAKKELDWHPKISAKKAIKLTLDWFKNSINKQEDIVSTLIRDIKLFEDA